ncbi:uncharacterized protein G2W53_023938 [Senna tora]|uniref:Uncharacterized protein n=1 Tax=Senna tora TaxID=362788 RepID=A0A834TAA0_9FABA|nr:uncharacterized protein G2W53_023938 [Senna tora]
MGSEAKKKGSALVVENKSKREERDKKGHAGCRQTMTWDVL